MVSVYDGYVLKMFGECSLDHLLLFFFIHRSKTISIYFFFFPDTAIQASNYIQAREKRPLRPTNYFSSNKREYIQWKKKGIVEEIDLVSDDEVC